MKKLTLLLAALLASASLSAAEPASSYSVTVDFPYTTKYVFRGYEFAKGAFQPSVKVTSGDFYAGVWMSAPVDRGYELEVDYYAGYGFKLAEGWTLDAGLTAYSYPGLDTSGGADKTTFEGYVGVNGTLGIFSSGTYAYYDVTLKAFTIQEALGYSITLDEKTAVNLLATIGHVSPDVGSGYTYYGFGATVPYKLTDKATITAGVQYADHDIDGVEGSHFWGTLGFTYAF
ncbi:MAG: TorF family putative porin [Lacunisphaera sp.]|nr:TorF family putative porin [Lacunisphaera sp.]